jgi:hypothetical protein
MTDRELMRQAVVALDLAMLHGEYPQDAGIFREISNAANALSARLAQPEPEPVADKYLMEVECTKCGAKQDGVLTVTAPQQRNWQGLTDEEMFDCLAQTDGEAKRLPLGFKWFAEAIEAKLREKNA